MKNISMELSLKAFVVFTRAYKQLHLKDIQSINSCGLTQSQFAVLEVLYHKGDMRISEVMKKILGTHGNMTMVVKNLEREGFVRRYSCPNDARASMIALTQKSNILLDEFFPKHAAYLHQLFSNLNDKEKEQLIKLLKKLSGV